MVDEIIKYRKDYPGKTTYHTFPLGDMQDTVSVLMKEFKRFNLEVDLIRNTVIIGIHFNQK
jgi:hypothetical protein